MEEYIADLQEQLITAQHRFMKMHRDMKKVHLQELTKTGKWVCSSWRTPERSSLMR